MTSHDDRPAAPAEEADALLARLDQIADLGSGWAKVKAAEQVYRRAERLAHPQFMARARIEQFTALVDLDEPEELMAYYSQMLDLVIRHGQAIRPDVVSLILGPAYWVLVEHLLDAPAIGLDEIEQIIGFVAPIQQRAGVGGQRARAMAALSASRGDMAATTGWLDRLRADPVADQRPAQQLLFDVDLVARFDAMAAVRRLDQWRPDGSSPSDRQLQVTLAVIETTLASIVASPQTGALRARLLELSGPDEARDCVDHLAWLLRAYEGTAGQAVLVEECILDQPLNRAGQWAQCAALAHCLLTQNATDELGRAMAVRARRAARELDARNDNTLLSAVVDRHWLGAKFATQNPPAAIGRGDRDRFETAVLSAARALGSDDLPAALADEVLSLNDQFGRLLDLDVEELAAAAEPLERRAEVIGHHQLVAASTVLRHRRYRASGQVDRATEAFEALLREWARHGERIGIAAVFVRQQLPACIWMMTADPQIELTRIEALLDQAQAACDQQQTGWAAVWLGRAVLAGHLGERVRADEALASARGQLDDCIDEPGLVEHEIQVLARTDPERALELADQHQPAAGEWSDQDLTVRCTTAALRWWAGRRDQANALAQSLLTQQLPAGESMVVRAHQIGQLANLLRALGGSPALTELVLDQMVAQMSIENPADMALIAGVGADLIGRPGRRDAGEALAQVARTMAGRFDQRNANQFVGWLLERQWFNDLPGRPGRQ